MAEYAKKNFLLGKKTILYTKILDFPVSSEHDAMRMLRAVLLRLHDQLSSATDSIEQ